jgi:predicted NAD/FAD-binding protein
MIEPQLQDTCSLSYNMNLLQNLSAKKTYCVSINQNHLINKELTIAEFTYAHPIYTKAGFNAQKQHLQISGQDDIYYCGAYWGYGFHEDGVQSALHISEQLGGSNL